MKHAGGLNNQAYCASFLSIYKVSEMKIIVSVSPGDETAAAQCPAAAPKPQHSVQSADQCDRQGGGAAGEAGKLGYRGQDCQKRGQEEEEDAGSTAGVYVQRLASF